MSTSFISHSPSPSTHSHLHGYAAVDPEDLHYHHRSPAPATAASVAESYPSRCASPLLPMGQYRTPSSHQTIDPDRLSQQLGKVTNRQSQQSVVHKNYAIPEDEDTELPPDSGKRSQTTRFISYHRTPSAGSKLPSRRTMPRQKSYRISTSADPHQSSVRELSSKLKSACRKLNPKRLTKHGHAHQDSEEPPLSDLPYPEVFGGVPSR
ncbi:hypothetical protein GGI01_002842 [Coemansia sp. RSA 376]|nr:hypothetical protein GGI01_002842 [Coemansia sp. RSA 376]